MPLTTSALPKEINAVPHPGCNFGADVTSISHRCCLREESFELELTKETIYLPLGYLQDVDLKLVRQVHSEIGHTILDPWETVAAAKGKPIITYQPFVDKWKILLKQNPVVIAETVYTLNPNPNLNPNPKPQTLNPEPRAHTLNPETSP